MGECQHTVWASRPPDLLMATSDMTMTTPRPVHDPLFLALENTLKAELGSGPVYYLPNPGNWGDSLIRHGAEKFFRDKGIEVQMLDSREAPSSRQSLMALPAGGTVIYGGGGGWCANWAQGPNRVRLLHHKCKVIVLPSSYETRYAFDNTVFFSRDRFESLDNMPQAQFCHDMAFYIGDEFCTADPGEGTGHFFRTDSETQPGRPPAPAGNNDLSCKGNHHTPVEGFFKAINRFAVVKTDRLHVAIAACLLGKEVHLYPGAYFKSHAIYRSSIEGRFDRVHFHPDFDWAATPAI